MSKRAHKPTRRRSTRRALASAVLLLSCLPLWGDEGPDLKIDPARSTFRVVGASPNEVTGEGWQNPLLVLNSHEESISTASLSADGRRILSGGRDGAVRVWDAATGALLHTMEGRHEGAVYEVSLSADGRTALSGGEDKIVRVWDAREGKLLHAMEGHKYEVNAVSLSAEGRIALSGSGEWSWSGEGEGILRVWDAWQGKLLHVMKGHERWVSDVSLSADGRTALSGSGDRTVRVWDAWQGKLLHIMEDEDPDNIVRGVSLSADGRIALSGGDGKVIEVWDAWRGKSLRYAVLNIGRRRGSDVRSVALSADGRLALSGGQDSTVGLWDAATDVDQFMRSMRHLHTMKGHKDTVYELSLSADGRLALSLSADGTARLWRLPLVHPQPVLHQTAERYAMQAVEARIGPAIPKPTLPPVGEYDHGPSETMTSFERHVTRARNQRARNQRARRIRGIEAQYRAAVERRNARVRAFEKNQGPGVRLTAYAKAVAEVYGHPVLKPVYDYRESDGPRYPPRYASSVNPPAMYIALRFQHTAYSWGWLFQVPPGEPARDLNEALEVGTVSATTEYRLEDDVLSLVAVHAHHGDVQYKGRPAAGGEYTAPRVVARMPVRRIPGQGDQPYLLKPQNPNLEDAAFAQYQTRHRPEFEDDIPGLHEQAEAAEPDPRKWLFAIGIEEYAQADNIPHADRSAWWLARAAARVLGVTAHRQIVLRGDQATAAAIAQRLNEMLKDVRKGDHIYFYYAGHGIPTPEQGNAPHILPQDVIPDFVGEHEQYRIENIHRQLTESKAAKVIAFLDTCFTGQTEHGSVFKGKAKARLTPKPLKPPGDGKLAIFTACTKNQYPGPYHEKGHRLFSYFLIRELLSGEHATIGALAKQVSANMARAAKTLAHVNRQNPVLHGNKTLMMNGRQ